MRRSTIDPAQHDLLDAAVELMGRAGRQGTVRVRGESMVPTLLPGQTILADFAAQTPRLGDLLLFRQEGTLIVHRYLGPSRKRDGKRGYRTRGDGSKVLDPVVYPDKVVGRGIAVQRDGRWYSMEGGLARIYGAALALHDLFWYVAARCAALPDRFFGLLGIRRPLCRLAQAFDRRLLALADGIFFTYVHREMEPPAAQDGERTPGPE